MTSNRREFLGWCTAAAPLAGLPALCADAFAAEDVRRPPRNPESSRILLNHVGFLPAGAKNVVVENPPQPEYTVLGSQFIEGRRVTERRAVFTGRLSEVNTDLERAWVGDFSDFKEGGIYVIRCGNLSSRQFVIHPRLYDYPLHVLFNYFPSQRCGDSVTGYNAPCHERDGRRVDNGQHVDVSGGWHQSCDCRKWMTGTPFGLLGLSRLGLLNHPRWDRGQIDEEIRWGNSYFLKMIRPDGGLMDHVVMPLGWRKERDLYANDAPLPAFYLTIVGEAMAAEYFKSRDPQYESVCIDAGRRLWSYVNRPDAPRKPYNPPVVPQYHDFLRDIFKQQYPGSALALGDSMYAALFLCKATGNKEFLDLACREAGRLVALQWGGDVAKDPAAACFREAPGKTELASTTYFGFFGPLGLCELAKTVEKHAERNRWIDAAQRIAGQFCLMSQRNPFGLIPSYWYAQDPRLVRKGGSAFYRYFFNQFGLRVGLNPDILGRAIFLLHAFDLFQDRRYWKTACRQIDWVLGCNPFDMSTVEGLGYNQPVRLISEEFFPPTPQIPGAVMTGILGDEFDEPVLAGGILHEYDMPPTSLLMWLLAEIQEKG
jgi:hypothetical protein